MLKESAWSVERDFGAFLVPFRWLCTCITADTTQSALLSTNLSISVLVFLRLLAGSNYLDVPLFSCTFISSLNNHKEQIEVWNNLCAEVAMQDINSNFVYTMMHLNSNNHDNQTHPDLRRAISGIMLQDHDLSSTTGCNSWQKLHESHPVFASRVSDKNNLFTTYRGTAVGKCDWKSNSLSVSDMRLIFPTEKECADYHIASLQAHPELFMKGKEDAMIPSMVEMRIEGSDEHFMIGTHCKIYCGPTNEARERMIESLTRGKSEQEQKFLVERASQVVKLVYLFCVVSFLVASEPFPLL